MVKILLLLWILYPSLSDAQYYYAPYPPTYPSSNYQYELNQYIQQQYVNDQQTKWEDEYKETRAWEKSDDYKDPWGYKSKHQPFDEDD